LACCRAIAQRHTGGRKSCPAWFWGQRQFGRRAGNFITTYTRS
jgi:hypothetical protein